MYCIITSNILYITQLVLDFDAVKVYNIFVCGLSIKTSREINFYNYILEEKIWQRELLTVTPPRLT